MVGAEKEGKVTSDLAKLSKTLWENSRKNGAIYCIFFYSVSRRLWCETYSHQSPSTPLGQDAGG